MTERLHLLVAAVALAFAMAVGCAHTPPRPVDPSFDPSSAVPFQEVAP